MNGGFPRGPEEIALVDEEGRVVCERCEVADDPLSRARGLLGRDGLSDGAGILIRPCRAIHTCFLRFPIDVVFLDRDLRVVGVVASLRPWRFAARRGADSVLELPAGTAARRGVGPGRRLAWGAVEATA